MLENIKVFELERNNKTLEIELMWGCGYNLYIKKIKTGNKEFDLSINKCELLKTDRVGDFIRINTNIKNKELEKLAEELTGKKFTQESLGIVITKDFRTLMDNYIHDCDLLQEQERDKFDKKLIEDNTDIGLSYTTGRGYYFPNKEESNKLQTYEKTLNKHKKLFTSDIFEKFQDNIDVGDYSITYTYRIPMDELMAVMKEVNSIVYEHNKAKIEKEEKEKERVQKLFELAKETGTKQIIKKWIEPCNDPHEECNVDEVYLLAMPDGTTKKERNHTW